MASAASYSNLVQELYVAYFGRPADYFGLQNFEAALAAANAPTDIAGLEAAYSTNAGVKTLVDSFSASPESKALYGVIGTNSTESFVNAVFENLLNRAPAVAGLTFWVNAINSGQVSPGDAALAIAAGAQANTTSQGMIDATTIANKIAVASNFTTDLGGSSESIVAYSGAGAATSARALIAGVSNTTIAASYEATVQSTITSIVDSHGNNIYNLTPGVDTIVGGPGNNSFYAVLDNTAGLAAGGEAATLNSFDSITGGTLLNTLNVTDFGQGGQLTFPSGAAISGITALNINSLEGIGSGTGSGALDLTTIGTLNDVNINASRGSDFVKVGDTTALVITDTSSADTVFTYGGSSVVINNNPQVGSYGNFAQVHGGVATTEVTINNGYFETNYIYDLNNGTGKANTITTVNASDQLRTATEIDSDALTHLNLTGDTDNFYDVIALAGTRTLNLDLNNVGNTAAFSGNYVEVEDGTATSVIVTATGVATNTFYLRTAAATDVTFNDAVDLAVYAGIAPGSASLYAPAAKSVTITGAGAFTADLSGLHAGAVVDASGSSGVVTVAMASVVHGSDPTESFIGGAGQDIVTVGVGQTGSVSGGTASNNEIVLAFVPDSTETALASYSHFTTFGVSGTTSGVFNMNGLGYTSYDVQGAGDDVTFANVSSGNSLSIDANDIYNVVWQTATGAGATESANVTLGTDKSNISVGGLTLEDSAHNGTGTVNLVTTHVGDFVSTFKDVNLTTLNISGAGTSGIGNVMNDVSTTLTLNNTSTAMSGVSIFAGVDDDNLTTLTLGGSATTAVGIVTGTGTSLTIVDNNTAPVGIGFIYDTALTSLTLTNSVNSTAATFDIAGAVNETGLTSLNLNGNVSGIFNNDTVTTGITVAGSTDNATVSFTSTGVTAAKAVDSVTLGNGAGDTSCARHRCSWFDTNRRVGQRRRRQHHYHQRRHCQRHGWQRSHRYRPHHS